MSIIILEENEPKVSTLSIATGLNKTHKSVFELTNTYKTELGSLGVVTFRTEKPKTGSKGGRPQEYAMLNEEQTTFLISLMRNNGEVIGFKLKLTKEFYRMKKALADVMVRQQSEEWKHLRANSKATRKLETDTIEQFVQYATKQGSTQAFRYYANISKMENKALFMLEQKFSSVRDLLTGYQIGIIMSADMIVEKALRDGMRENMPYKDIYLLAKDRIEIFASVIPKTMVPMPDNRMLE